MESEENSTYNPEVYDQAMRALQIAFNDSRFKHSLETALEEANAGKAENLEDSLFD